MTKCVEDPILIALHSRSCNAANLASAMNIARAAGFDAIEIYFDAGDIFTDGQMETYLGLLEASPLPITMVDVLIGIENRDPVTKKKLLQRFEQLAKLAKASACNVIQCVPWRGFVSYRPDQMLEELIENLKDYIELSAKYDVCIGLEPVVFSPFHNIGLVLEVIDRLGSNYVTVVLDVWHLWATDTPWEELYNIPLEYISSVHLSDCSSPKEGPWFDADRNILPGEGILPIHKALTTLSRMGYCGIWTAEYINEKLEQEEAVQVLTQLNITTRRLLRRHLADSTHNDDNW